MPRAPATTFEEKIIGAIRAFDACGKHIVRARINGRGVTIETDGGESVAVRRSENDDEGGSDEIIL